MTLLNILSALKENEAYLDSIQGKLDLFNNSVQTMWMNTLSSDAIKTFVNLGTGLIETIDKLGLVETLIAGIVTYVTTFSKNKIDLASMLGIHNLDDTFTKGFSAFGKQGFTGWVANKFKSKQSGDNIVAAILGDPSDFEASVEDFASAIQGNIDDYVTIDTSKIDTEIDSIQNKLLAARKELNDAKSRDWNYYKTMGSRSPAKDRDNAVKEKISEIDQLENKLLELQHRRDSIVNSAVKNVATSMADSVNNEIQSHKSLLSVLSEVKNTKLYLGDEQDAATKIDDISAAAKKGQSELINYASSLSDTDVALKAYVASVKDGNYSLAGFQQFVSQHNKGLKASGVAAKAAAIGHSLLNTALSMGISMLASFAINAVVKQVDKAITTTKEAAEAAEAATNKYEEMQSTLQKQKKTIDELSVSYERLSKGVDLDTNDNISLTTSSYEEYLDICNQIADMYPHLVTGFDAQGNAIISLKGNVDGLIQAYRESAQAARQAMIADGKNIFNTFKNTYNSNPSVSWDTTGLNQQIKLAKKLQELINGSSQDEINEFFNNLNSNNIEIDGQKYSNIEFDDLIESAGIDDSFYKNGFIRKSEIDIEAFKQQLPKLLSFVKSTTSKINTETSKVKSLLSAYLGEDLNYASYSDKTRAYIDQIVSNLDAEFIREFDTADALYNHIKTNIVDVFKDPSVTDALGKLSKLQLEFNKGDISYADYEDQLIEYINKIQNKFDSETLSQIKIGIGIDEASLQVAENHIATMVDGFNDEGKIIDDVQNKINSLSVEDLQIAGQLEVPEGTIYSWDELLEKIRQAKIAASEDFDLTDYKDSINSITESVSSYQEAIQKLDKGSFTLSDFMELIEDMPDLAKGVDISSKSFNGLRSNLQKAIKTSTKSFINDLKELKYRLIETGKSTEAIDQLINAVEDIPEDALDSTIDKYSTLADEIDRTRVAQNRLSESMGENPNEGYETRGEAMDYMKEAMEKGEIGSESNLWNVAKQYGFTYDSAKTINENADALAKFIAVREKWFATEDDGDDRTEDGYSFKGIESYIKSVESAVKKNAELQKYLTWDYDEDTGKFNFDYDNENLTEIVSLLGQTKSLAGLTTEEFMDLMVQIGQYFEVKWGDKDDVLQHLDGIATSAKDAKTKVEEYGEEMQKYFGENTTIDLTARPMVKFDSTNFKDWEKLYQEIVNNPDGHSEADVKNAQEQLAAIKSGNSYATVYSSTFSSEDGTKSIVVTPILPDGTVLSPEELESYAQKLLAGEEIDPKINIKLGEFSGTNSQKQADEYAQTLHEVQAQYDQLRDTLGINTTLDSSGIEGLKNIEAIQKTITTNSKGLTIIDQEAFTKVLTDAGYAEDQIELIIDKIKELNSESITSDSFKIDEALTANGIAGLKEIESLQSAIKESSSGLTVVDTDMFASVLQEAGYTKTQIDELIKKIQEYESVVLTSGNTDPLGLNATNMSIDTLKSSLSTLGVDFDESIGKWFDGEKELKINVPDLIATLTEKGWSEESIRNYCTQLSQTNIEGFTVKVSQEEIDAAIEKANEVPAEKPINVEVTGTAHTDLQNINTELNKIQDKTIDVTINETTVKKTKEADANGTVWWNPTTWFADGTAHAGGTAFAGGNWGAPRTETALTGELGPELLVRGNRWTTVGENGAEFTQVRKGDIIFNH